MSDQRDIYRLFSKRPMMFIMGNSYGEHVAFLRGMDFASDTQILDGFTPWLFSKLGYGQNLVWSGLVILLAFPDSPDPYIAVDLLSRNDEDHRIRSLSPNNNRIAVAKLHELIEEFLSEKET